MWRETFFLRVNWNGGDGESAFNFKGQKLGEKPINISFAEHFSCCSRPLILKEVFYWRNSFSCWHDGLVCIAFLPGMPEIHYWGVNYLFIHFFKDNSNDWIKWENVYLYIPSTFNPSVTGSGSPFKIAASLEIPQLPLLEELRFLKGCAQFTDSFHFKCSMRFTL